MLSGRLPRMLWSLLLVFCGIAVNQAAAADTPPTASPEVWTYLNGLAPQQRLAVLEQQAAREGQFTLYGALGIDRAQLLIKFFNASYPKIKVNFVRQQESELVQRINTEARARHVDGDAAISSVNWLDLLKGSLGGYQPTTWGDFDPGFVFGGAQKGWTAIAYEVLPSTIAWRTDRITRAQAPHTLEQVADPKWKGRVGTTSHLEALSEGLISALGRDKAMPLIDKLAALNNRLYPSIAALADGLAQGEIDMAWNMGAHRSVRLKSQGAPVDFNMQDPLLGQGITISVIKGARHPYAAALFMEVLTRATTLESLDRAEGGRVFGNTKGHYQIDLKNLPRLTIFQPITPKRYAELGRMTESKFLRR
jgi:iron(III) transport system substrate-binding protein